jgi:putative sterol carrier protein
MEIHRCFSRIDPLTEFGRLCYLRPLKNYKVFVASFLGSMAREEGKTMAVRYPSDEWIKELSRILNEDPEFKDVAGDFSGKFIFQIEAEAGKLDQTAFLSVRVNDGTTSEAKALSSLDECPDADYVVSGKYSVWKNVVQGKQEPLRAIMTRKLRLVKGKQLKLLKEVKLALKIMNSSAGMDVDYPDDE